MGISLYHTHLESIELLLKKLCFKELISKSIRVESESHVCPFNFLLPNMADCVGQVPSVRSGHCSVSARTQLLAC